MLWPSSIHSKESPCLMPNFSRNLAGMAVCPRFMTIVRMIVTSTSFYHMPKTRTTCQSKKIYQAIPYRFVGRESGWYVYATVKRKDPEQGRTGGTAVAQLIAANPGSFR